MIRLEEILDRVGSHHPGDNLDLIRRAYIFSAKEHKGQVRASGEPYDAQRHDLSSAIKAVTWHEAAVEQTAEGYKARIIFDI